MKTKFLKLLGLAAVGIAIAVVVLLIQSTAVFGPNATDLAPTDNAAGVQSLAASDAGQLSSPEALLAWQTRIKDAEFTDFERLLAEALAIPDATLRTEVLGALSVRWINIDRRTFVRMILDAEARDVQGAGIWDKLLPAFAKAFPDVDQEAAASPVFNDIVQKFVEHYAIADPDATLAWVEQWLLDETRDQAVAGIIAQMNDPEEANTLLDTVRNPYRRVEGTMAIASMLGEQNAETVMAWVTSRPDSLEQAIALENAVHAMAAYNPPEAGMVMDRFTAQIVQKANEALAGIPEEDRGRPVGENAVGWGTPEQRIAAHLEGKLFRLRDATVTVAFEWGSQNIQAALAWADTLPLSLQSVARSAAIEGLAETNPSRALTLAAEHGVKSPELVQTAFETLAQKDVAAALNHLGTIPDETLRPAAVTAVVRTKAVESPEIARRWAETQPPGPERDAGLRAVAEAIRASDPAAAWDAALGISDSKSRESALRETFGFLVIKDVERAGQLLAAASLSKEIRTHMERQLRAITESAPMNR